MFNNTNNTRSKTSGEDTSSEDSQNDFQSRSYQDKILQKCIEKNTIVYLPTGSGKTYIAIQAIKHFAADLQRPIQEGGKRSVFLANTVALAKQQAASMAKYTALKVAHYTGDMNVDNWNKERWFEEFNENQVIVATCQIILDVIRHGYLKLCNLNVMVFDECHHGKKEHPMAMLMAKFDDCAESEHPRVIGLTGSLTKASIKPQNVVSDLYELESTFRSTITTAQGAKAFNEVLMYSTSPIENTLSYGPANTGNRPVYRRIAAKIKAMVQKIEKWPFPVDATKDYTLNKRPSTQNSLKSTLNDLLYQLETYGLYGGLLSTLAVLVEFELKKRESDTHTAKLLIRSLITELEEVYHILAENVYDEDQMDLDDEIINPDDFDERNMKDDPATILSNSTDQVQRLLIFLADHMNRPSNQKIKSLVFVQRRSSAKILCNIIRRYANATMDLKVDFMVGNNSRMPESIETYIQNRNNNKVLEQFRRGEVDMIVATNVLEEGIDLQDCNLVIAFDEPKHYRAYVQMKGRARNSTSKYIIMHPSAESNAMSRKISEWKCINEILRKYLVERAVDRPIPLQEDMERIIKERINETYTTPERATVDYFSAISLLNRYIQTLPTDYFTKPTITWRKIQEKPTDKLSIAIELPLQTPLRQEIRGIPTDSVLVGKRSAAFEVCKQLHLMKCLSDNLLPISEKRFIDLHKDEYFPIWANPAYADDTNTVAGTKKNLRIRAIKTPDEFIESMPKCSTNVYLYKINIQPHFRTADARNSLEERENIEVFHQLMESNRGYGILTAKKLPRISPMKFFFSFGHVECTLSAESVPLTITEESQLAALKRFHCVLFRNVLDIWKNFYVYDHDDSVLIVPTKNQKIDWITVHTFQQWTPLSSKTVSERNNCTYNENEWRHMVITPWYRADVDVRYVVTRLSTNLSPSSPFPNDDYQSYGSYALEKYPDIGKIANNQQFLMHVKPVTRNLNILYSGDGEEGGKRKSTRGQELLIPELCHNFKFPGDLWLKALVVPAFLHRLTYILHAEQLRLRINAYVGLNIGDYVPQPLFDKMPKKRKSHEKPNIQNPITFPRPRDNEAVELRMTNVQPMNALTDDFQHENQLPVDIDRNFSTVYPVDIEYYYTVISGRLREISINDVDMQYGMPAMYQRAPPAALCDVPSNEKLHINILDVKLTTPVPRGVELHELLAAITTAKSADVFHMELYEVLGDAFLKFGISLYLLGKHSNWHEGNLTQMKGQIVGNRNLFYCGDKLGIPGIIKASRFNPQNDWQPPMLTVDKAIKDIMKGRQCKPDILNSLELSAEEVEAGEVSFETEKDKEKKKKKEAFLLELGNECSVRGPDCALLNFLDMHQVADKTVADAVEAILGTCVKSIGIERSFKVLEMFGILPISNEWDITTMLRRKLISPRIRTNIRDHEVNEMITNYKVLEHSIGYTFKDRAYLLQALTHPSYPTNRLTGCYQQLEFLGDAVLDFLITAYIYERCPHMDPGQLTDLRSALVNNVTLACLAVRNDFHRYMLSQNQTLGEHITKFVDFQIKQNHEVTEHVEILREEQDVLCGMAECVDVPKALGDIFEALIGAIFLDSGNDLLVTWKIIYRLMSKEIEKFMRDIPIQLVRRLYEHPTANPEFDQPRVNENGVVLVNLQFTCNGIIRIVHGLGNNKENAKRAASKVALLNLHGS